MPFTEGIIKQKLFFVVKIIILVLVAIALVTELLPEIEAKLIVIPTLVIILIIGLIDLKKDGLAHV